MFKRALFATDFSEHSMIVLDHLKEFEDLGLEEVVVLRVINLNRLIGVSGGINLDEYVEVCRKEAEEKLREVVERIEGMGFRAKPVLPIPAGDPVLEIVKTAKESGSNLILMGSRGRGLIREILLGSTSEGVVKRAEVPVMVFKRPVERLFGSIVVAHDLKDHSDLALKYAKFVAERKESEITLVHVVEKGERLANEKLKAIEEGLLGLNFRTIVREGTPHKEILKVCEEVNATSIFIGGGIPETIAERLLGSTADAILRYSKIPVFVAKS